MPAVAMQAEPSRTRTAAEEDLRQKDGRACNRLVAAEEQESPHFQRLAVLRYAGYKGQRPDSASSRAHVPTVGRGCDDEHNQQSDPH